MGTENLAAVAGVNDPSSGGDSARCHGRAITHQQAERRASVRVTRFDGNAGAHLDGCAWGERYAFQRKKVIAEIFAGVGDYGRVGAGV